MIVVDQVFHEGEASLHRSLGIEERLDDLGRRMIRNHMPDQHREFFAMLPWVHLGAVDRRGHPWAFVRIGEPGFVNAPDPKTLSMTSRALSGEPKDLMLSPGSKISVVAIDLATRRRNRLNATITSATDTRMMMRVDQSYGNCPKYIQKRSLVPPRTTAAGTGVVDQHGQLTADDVRLLEQADTLFIASRSSVFDDDPRSGVDINHRGGPSGFIEILDRRTISFPDYKGNNFHNTLGNLILDDRIGIQIVAFDTGTVLHLQGRADLIAIDDPAVQPPDTGRRLRIRIKQVVRAEGALPLRFTFVEASPFLPASLAPDMASP